MKSLNLFERDAAARDVFLARIPTRRIEVDSATARRIARAQARAAMVKGVRVHGAGRDLIDAAINRALDKAEGKR
jgi:hypothetical protein